MWVRIRRFGGLSYRPPVHLDESKEAFGRTASCARLWLAAKGPPPGFGSHHAAAIRRTGSSRVATASGSQSEAPDTSSIQNRELIAIDGAPEELAKMTVLEISAQSVMRDWKLAKAWLACELGKAGFK